MREVLFRAKRKSDGIWVYGAYVAKNWYPTGNVFEGKVVEESNIIDYEYECLWNKVIPESVSEFTGLTDKNGKKIFEGDIVEYEHELSGFLRFEIGEDHKPRRSHSCYWDDKHYLHYKRNYAVEWKGKDARWILRNGSDQHDLRQVSLSMHNGVIIGNIHDNPELLKR